MTDAYTVFFTKEGKPTARRTPSYVVKSVLGNESYQRDFKKEAYADYWGVELNGKLKHVTTSRDAARMYRREKCPAARVVALG